MIQTIKLSIILPVYNVERYIEECLNSILPQLTNETELIIVNDCTPDSSIDICKEITIGYEEVHIVERKKNGGLSAARNTGIESARGEYIWFVDSDDVIEDNAVGVILQRISESSPDVLHFNHIRFDENGIILKSKMNEGFVDICNTRLQFMLTYLKNDQTGFEVWRRAYSANIIKKYNLHFQPNKEVFAEDICFNIDFLNYCNTICMISDSLYRYRIRNDSIMGKLNQSKLQEMQNLAWHCYLSTPHLDIKEHFSVLYSKIMQIHYNMSDISDFKQYCDNLQNAGFVIQMNRIKWSDVSQYIDVLGEKSTLLCHLYSRLILSLIQDKKMITRLCYSTIECLRK